MNAIMSLLRAFFAECIRRIDSGDCDLSIEDTYEVMNAIKHFTEKDVRMSKYQACEYLKISRATFDNYVAKGLIPKGKHQQGFKELHWLQKDLDKFKSKFKK